MCGGSSEQASFAAERRLQVAPQIAAYHQRYQAIRRREKPVHMQALPEMAPTGIEPVASCLQKTLLWRLIPR